MRLWSFDLTHQSSRYRARRHDIQTTPKFTDDTSYVAQLHFLRGRSSPEVPRYYPVGVYRRVRVVHRPKRTVNRWLLGERIQRQQNLKLVVEFVHTMRSKNSRIYLVYDERKHVKERFVATVLMNITNMIQKYVTTLTDSIRI